MERISFRALRLRAGPAAPPSNRRPIGKGHGRRSDHVPETGTAERPSAERVAHGPLPPARYPMGKVNVEFSARFDGEAARIDRSMKAPSDSAAPTSPRLDVHLDSWLREFGPRQREQVFADTVEHLLDELEGRYPRLRFKLRDETGQLRRYVRVFVDGEDVSGTTGVRTSLLDAQTIDILHSIAGG